MGYFNTCIPTLALSKSGVGYLLSLTFW